MKYLVIALRAVLGLTFLVFGLNQQFEFFKPPVEPSTQAQAFWTAMVATGYFMPLLSWTKVACGALLVLGRFVPLALTVLAPIIVQILLYHLYLDPQGMEVALVVLGLELILVALYWSSFKTVLRASAPYAGSTTPLPR